jgi:group I intron endonuclease
MITVYKATNVINGKTYVGITNKTIRRRFQAHLSFASPIGNALRKYGIKNFFIRYLETARTLNSARRKERLWVKRYDCISPNGYNLTAGGEGLFNPSAETRAKLSAANLRRGLPVNFVAARILFKPGNLSRTGQLQSESERKKKSESLRKHYQSPEGQARRQRCRIRMTGPDNPFFQKTHTAKTRAKISKALTKLYQTGWKGYNVGKHLSQETRDKIALHNSVLWSDPKERSRLSKAIKLGQARRKAAMMGIT